jgi:hypothetical protein
MFGQIHEWGIMGGMMNYTGDLSPGIVFKESNPAGGAFYKLNHNRFFSTKINATYGKISGNDANYSFNQLRNLSFSSNIIEVGGNLEFNFLPFGSDRFSKPFTPYASLGFSGFYFNPTTIFEFQSYDLRNYGTEGQFIRHSKTYLNVNWAIPMGGGFKFHLNKNWVLGIEGIWRHTATDYLDDVSNGNYDLSDDGQYRYTGYPSLRDQQKFNSLKTQEDKDQSIKLSDRSGEINPEGNLSFGGKQRGNPDNKDWYLTVGVTLSYKIIKYSCTKGGF